MLTETAQEKPITTSEAPDHRESGQIAVDRRKRRRFPIQADTNYRLVSSKRVSGDGRILNISSSGVQFTTDQSLQIGKTVELAVNWPALLENKCLLKLVITGVLIRSDGGSAVMRITRYEFRIRASRPPLV